MDQIEPDVVFSLDGGEPKPSSSVTAAELNDEGKNLEQQLEEEKDCVFDEALPINTVVFRKRSENIGNRQTKKDCSKVYFRETELEFTSDQQAKEKTDTNKEKVRASLNLNSMSSSSKINNNDDEEKQPVALERPRSLNALINSQAGNESTNNNGGSSTDSSDDYEEIFDPSLIFLAIYRCFNWDSKDRIRKGKIFLTKSELFFKCSGMPFVKVRIRLCDIHSVNKLKNYKNGMESVLSVKTLDTNNTKSASYVFYRFRLPKSIIKNTIENLKKESELALNYDPESAESSKFRRRSKALSTILNKNLGVKKEDTNSEESIPAAAQTPTTIPIGITKAQQQQRDSVDSIETEDNQQNKRKAFKNLKKKWTSLQTDSAAVDSNKSTWFIKRGGSTAGNNRPQFSSRDGSPQQLKETEEEQQTIIVAEKAINLRSPLLLNENSIDVFVEENIDENNNNKESLVVPDETETKTTMIDNVTTWDDTNTQEQNEINDNQLLSNQHSSKHEKKTKHHQYENYESQTFAVEKKSNRIVIILSPIIMFLFISMSLINFFKMDSLERQLSEI